MMLVKRYQGRIIKRMRRVPGGILLTFLVRNQGDRGEQLLVTQQQWNWFGSQKYERTTLAELRRRLAE